jgi:hypothetical protein
MSAVACEGEEAVTKNATTFDLQFVINGLS